MVADGVPSIHHLLVPPGCHEANSGTVWGACLCFGHRKATAPSFITVALCGHFLRSCTRSCCGENGSRGRLCCARGPLSWRQSWNSAPHVQHRFKCPVVRPPRAAVRGWPRDVSGCGRGGHHALSTARASGTREAADGDERTQRRGDPEEDPRRAPPSPSVSRCVCCIAFAFFQSQFILKNGVRTSGLTPNKGKQDQSLACRLGNICTNLATLGWGNCSVKYAGPGCAGSFQSAGGPTHWPWWRTSP